MSKSILIAVAIAMLAGCTTEPPPERAYPPEFAPPPPPRAAKAPAETTAPASSLHKAEVKPLGRGLLAAQAAGGYMDGQEKELRADLRGTGITVSRMGDSLVLNLRSDTVFGGKTAEISEKGRRILDKISDSVRKFDSTQIVINGFTDTTGTEARNLKVSQERADTVAKAFTEGGVDAHRVAAKGFGDEILKIPTGPDVSEPRNRRLEIRITPRVKT